MEKHKTRIEADSIGNIEVPINKYWGAQTQRSLDNFKIGEDKIPLPVIKSYARLKKATAIANFRCEELSKEKSDIICTVCDEIIEGKLDDHFPLVVYQTGSGTHTNMNLNEVIVNRAQELIGKGDGAKKFLHPNDDVNMSQSSNDTFPTVMNVTAYLVLLHKVLPALNTLKEAFEIKSEEFENIIKTGRTHMMDAAPISLGQEISAFVTHFEKSINNIEGSLEHLSELAIGGSAVGTGLNVPEGFDKIVVAELSIATGVRFKIAENKFEAMSFNDAIVSAHSHLKNLAVSMIKILNDLRMMASGPRCGLSEIMLPANEPGSSIMPGKVNPTQIEAALMVCSRIIGNDTTMSLAGINGQFQLNVSKPLMIHVFLESAELLADACRSLEMNCIRGILPNKAKINEYLNRSLMLATALNNFIGYDKVAKIVKLASKDDTSLKEACLKLGFLSEDEFDDIVNPRKMI